MRVAAHIQALYWCGSEVDPACRLRKRIRAPCAASIRVIWCSVALVKLLLWMFRKVVMAAAAWHARCLRVLRPRIHCTMVMK